jgi:hypothetical protein
MKRQQHKYQPLNDCQCWRVSHAPAANGMYLWPKVCSPAAFGLRAAPRSRDPPPMSLKERGVTEAELRRPADPVLDMMRPGAAPAPTAWALTALCASRMMVGVPTPPAPAPAAQQGHAQQVAVQRVLDRGLGMVAFSGLALHAGRGLLVS